MRAYINKQINKSTLKFVLNNLCEKNKYISSLNKEVTGVPTSCSNVLKCPVDLREIKRKITSSEITRLGELQISLLMMSFNAAMINHSTSIVNSDASDFQMDIKKHCREFKDAIGGNDSDNQILPKESNPKKINDYSIYDVQYPIEYKTPYFKNLVVNKKTFSNLFYNYLDNSSCEDSDSSNSDTLPLKKKRKLNMTYSSNSESD
ncbi:PREDICTED: uncharacterized protein LOC107169056 [Diuraphis noxia]|uniref:uncharacterized protein LOC107169056 n=1 Tax=Diuraphis noxia TaxID=143948 RepID=UPI00076355A5|nr:PREDICTED: uncharacterized protein LOC107169056 [Diuraphis noxia]